MGLLYCHADLAPHFSSISDPGQDEAIKIE